MNEHDEALASGKLREAMLAQRPEALHLLSRHTNRFVRTLVASRPLLTLGRLEELALYDLEECVRSSAVDTGRLSTKVIEEMWQRYPFGSAASIARAATAPPHILREIHGHGGWFLTMCLCLNPRITCDILANLAHNPPIEPKWLHEEQRWMNQYDLPAHDIRHIAKRALDRRSNG